MAIRFHLDEHVSPAIAQGLRRRGIDVTTTPQAGLSGAADELHLAFALREKRVIVSHDADFLALAAAGAPHAGIVYCAAGHRSIGSVLAYLELIDLCLTPEDMMNHIEYS